MTMWKRPTRDVWSPYGHEKARRQLLGTRRIQIVVVALAIMFLYALFLALTLQTEDNTSQGSTVVERPENEPVTLTVTPGRTPTFMNPQIKAPDGIGAPTPDYAQRSKMVQLVADFSPILAPLAVAFFLLGRAGTSAHGKLAELNFGIYKGAMPYEMHTARAYKHVFTHRVVDGHVFGKKREDFLFGSYLGAPPLAVRMMLGESGTETASVLELKQGRAPRRPRVTVRTADQVRRRERIPKWARDLLDGWGDPLVRLQRQLDTRRRRRALPAARRLPADGDA